VGDFFLLIYETFWVSDFMKKPLYRTLNEVSVSELLCRPHHGWLPSLIVIVMLIHMKVGFCYLK